MLELKKFFDSMIERNGNEAEAALVILIKPDGHSASVNVAGVDKLMIGNGAVALTAAIKDTLATHLFTASKILEMMEEHGQVRVERRGTEAVKIDIEKKPEADTNKGATDDKADRGECIDEARDFLAGLAELILEHL